MPASGDRKLQQALHDLVVALGATRVHWMVIGGIAVIARGVRRFTGDIDAAVRGDEIDVAPLIKALAKKRIVPRIAQAEQFARESLVLLLRHEPSGVEFDISFVWTDFEQEAIAAASIATFGTVKAPMAQPEDLIVFKAIAGRGKDIDDATALLSLYPGLDLGILSLTCKVTLVAGQDCRSIYRVWLDFRLLGCSKFLPRPGIRGIGGQEQDRVRHHQSMSPG